MSKFDLTQKDIHREVNRTITILSQRQEQICSTKNAQFPENCVEIQFLAERILLVAETCSETTKRQFVQYVWYAAMKYKICLILVTHGIKLGISFCPVFILWHWDCRKSVKNVYILSDISPSLIYFVLQNIGTSSLTFF